MIWSMTAIWLFLMIALLLVELLTMGIFCLWFAVGALVGLILSLVGLPLWAQIPAAILVSLILLLFARPFLVRLFNREKSFNDNEDLIGRDVIVVSEVDSRFGTGQILVDGQHLSAGTKDPTQRLPVGAVGRVVGARGSKLIVEGKDATIGRGKRKANRRAGKKNNY